MDLIFDLCVDLLVWLAWLTGLTYKQVNVIIFCLLWPALTIYQTVLLLSRPRRTSRRGADSADVS